VLNVTPFVLARFVITPVLDQPTEVGAARWLDPDGYIGMPLMRAPTNCGQRCSGRCAPQAPAVGSDASPPNGKPTRRQPHCWD
jgi:hypothetical protein